MPKTTHIPYNDIAAINNRLNRITKALVRLAEHIESGDWNGVKQDALTILKLNEEQKKNIGV